MLPSTGAIIGGRGWCMIILQNLMKIAEQITYISHIIAAFLCLEKNKKPANKKAITNKIFLSAKNVVARAILLSGAFQKLCIKTYTVELSCSNHGTFNKHKANTIKDVKYIQLKNT